MSLVQTGSASARETALAQFKNQPQFEYINSSKEELLSYANTDRTSKTPEVQDTSRSHRIIANLSAQVEQLKPGSNLTRDTQKVENRPLGKDRSFAKIHAMVNESTASEHSTKFEMGEISFNGRHTPVQ